MKSSEGDSVGDVEDLDSSFTWGTWRFNLPLHRPEGLWNSHLMSSNEFKTSIHLLGVICFNHKVLKILFVFVCS